MKKNDRFTVSIDNSTVEGYGVCRIEGRAVFVQGALSGEEWEIIILKVTNTAVWAKGVHCIAASNERCEDDCLNPCGGCALRHVQYSEELKIKQQHVKDCLQRIGNQIVETIPIHPSSSTLCYRNKAIFAVGESGGEVVFGFYRPRSHDIIPVKNCLLQSELCIRAAKSVTDFLNKNAIAPYNESTGKGTVRHIYFRQSRGGDAVLCIVTARGFAALTENLVQFVRSACPELTGIVLNINKNPGNTVLSAAFFTLWGSDKVRETFCGNTFLISPQAFLQVNPLQAENMYRTAINYASDSLSNGFQAASSENEASRKVLGSLALELYCGAGTISLGLSKYFQRVLAAEIVPEAVENAASNAASNGIENVEFICADAGSVADRLNREGILPDVVLVDPPRKGLSPQVVTDIVRMKPERVVYISCNPSTLARDVKLFSEMEYYLSKVEAFDMFPRTGHVETVVQLSKGNISSDRVRVEFSLEDMDMSRFQQGATYEQIQAWVQEKYGFHVTHLNIAQVKRKHGIVERKNYNKPKTPDSRQPGCPDDKVKAIEDALKHFQMI